MPVSLESFQTNLDAELSSSATSEGGTKEEAFLAYYGEWLTESADLETFDLVHHRTARGIRVDGYGGDPGEQDGQLSLIISDFHEGSNVGSLTRTDAQALFKRLENFFEAALTGKIEEELEPTHPAAGLARLIRQREKIISRLKLLIVSNRALSARYDGMTNAVVAHRPATYSVWDLSRLKRLIESGQPREDIEIDLQELFGRTLPCLPAHLGQDDYESYLAVLPGEVIASIYDRWGSQLLEQNVRSFLQARGKVNKGIRATLLNNPGMFFAYNNGITATAEGVVTESQGGQLHLRTLRNFQIVNGGQTTASLLSAKRRERADLSRVFVQMKLSVVLPENATEVVPRISEYANSQNRVNAADFFSNHPFHVRIEGFSRRIWAPALEGAARESKWFYERARGQYLDSRARVSGAKQTAFDKEYPKTQVFSKTDLAKYEMVWMQLPHVVSRGAQYNFSEFSKIIGQDWLKDDKGFNELYFRSAVTRAIVFKATERIISARPWYDGGYRANMVAYVISKLQQLVSQLGMTVDLDAIWQRQSISPALEKALITIADAIRETVTTPEAGQANVTEWAKKPGCWSKVQMVKVGLPEDFLMELLTAAQSKAATSAARKTQMVDDGIVAQTKVLEIPTGCWTDAITYARARKLLGPTDHDLLALAARPGVILTDRQSAKLLSALAELTDDGFIVPSPPARDAH